MLEVIAGYASSISCILALLAIIVKPIRERILGMDAIREGQQCLLRSEIVRTYYPSDPPHPGADLWGNRHSGGAEVSAPLRDRTDLLPSSGSTDPAAV